MARKLLSVHIAEELVREHRITIKLLRNNRNKVQEIVERNLRRRNPEALFHVIWGAQYTIDVNGIEFPTGRTTLRAMAALVIMNTIEQQLMFAQERRITQRKRKSQEHTLRRAPRMRVAV